MIVFVLIIAFLGGFTAYHHNTPAPTEAWPESRAEDRHLREWIRDRQ